MSDFKLIPYTNGRYAMNREGTVINTKTGKILTNKYQVGIFFKGKHRSFTRARLLELTFGIKMRYPNAISVTARRGNAILHFTSLFAASIGLAPLVFFSEETVYHKLKDRKPVIGDYQITYHEQRSNTDETFNE